MRSIWQQMQFAWTRLRSSKSGNAAMLAALGMPVLIGGAGLAVDTAQWFMWKRELQHAVDQAAIGGAWARSNSNSEDSYETRALQEFNANVSVTEDFAGAPSISLGLDSEGNANEVRVSATASRTLPFSGIVMGRPVTIAVQAVAQYRKGADFNACLVALSEDDDVLHIGGSATVDARCGLAALSCEDDAIVIDGSATVKTDSIATCGTADVNKDDFDEGVVNEGVQGLEDIYKDLDPPDNPTPQNYQCSGKGNNKLATLKPGTYKGGLVVKCTTVLNPGIYVIDGGELDLAANYNITGTNVMFVLKNGAKLKWGGSGNGNKITLTPMKESDFNGTGYEANADQYAGILVFEDRENNPPNPGHILNGNSASVIEGLMYMPSGTVTILGTADVASECLQISAYKIKVSGGANLETLCPVDETLSVGTALSDVRLIR